MFNYLYNICFLQFSCITIRLMNNLLNVFLILIEFTFISICLYAYTRGSKGWQDWHQSTLKLKISVIYNTDTYNNSSSLVGFGLGFCVAVYEFEFQH